MSEAASAPLLAMASISKGFSGVQALREVDFAVMPGEVHALLGENGAGKSTLIKILTGALRRDAGTISLGGRQVEFGSPLEAQHGGVSTIYQELNLVPYRAVAENIFLGREPRRFGLIDWRRMNRQAAELLERLNITVDVAKPLMAFNTSIQQMVAIARAISFDAKLVIMDEPTSSLDEREVETLFGIISKLKSDGVSVVYVSHRLDEIYAICDRLTVLRDGRVVARAAVRDMRRLELVAAMLGRKVEEVRHGATAFARERHASGARLLEAEGLRNGGKLRGASASVAAGEIVGLAGLLGSGRTELARAVFGADRLVAGRIAFGGREVAFREPADAIRAGLGYCTEDRKVEGIVPEMSVRDNLTLALLPQLARRGVIAADRQREVVDRFIQRLGIKARDAEQRIRDLSGGNQQKVLLARWLCMSPKLLLLDEPTRGIDVGAKAEIQALIRELADGGLGVLMISSEMEELVEGADRIVVLRDGVDVAVLDGEAATEEAIMAAIAQEDRAAEVAP